MDKQRRYTAQEMREMACHLIDICDAENECNEYRNTIGSFGMFDCESALRQAADAEDELAKVKARLAAVVKECETEKPKWIPAMECESIVKRSSMVDRYDRILRMACGEESAPCRA